MFGNYESDFDLALTVHACLTERKFLLVLDNVWTDEDWSAIQQVLLARNKKGKILVTRYHWRVGNLANPKRKAYILHDLTFYESCYTIQYEAFGQLNCCPLSLQGIMKF